MLMLAGTGASGVSSRGSDKKRGPTGQVSREWCSLGAGELLLSQGKAGWETGPQSLPLAAVGGERCRDRMQNTYLCWECVGSRAGTVGRWSAGRPGPRDCLQQKMRNVLRCLQIAPAFPPPS